MATRLTDADVGLAGGGKKLSDADVGLGDGGGVARQYVAGFNERLGDLLAAPSEIGGAIVGPAAKATSDVISRTFGYEPSDEPVRPQGPVTGAVTDYLRDQPEPTTQPERVSRRAGQITGETLPYAAVPFAMPATKAGGTTAQNIVRSVVETAKRAPGRTAAGEAVSATTAGIGSGVARETDPDNTTTEAIAMLAGGLAPTAPVMAARGTMKAAESLPVSGAIIRKIRASLLPFTTAGATVRASRRVRDLAGDPETATQRLDEDTVSDLSPAQRTGDKRLLALERAVLDADAKLDDEFAGKSKEAAQQLREAVEGMATDVPVSETRKYIEGRRAYLIGLLEERAKQAAALAEQRISRLGPEMRSSEASRIVREEIESALGQARAQESQLWEAVPKNTPLGTENARNAYDDLVASLPKAQLDDVPDVARRFLDPESNRFLGEENTVNEIWGLRSKLLEASRNARAAGEFNSARIANDLADALLDDLGARAGAIEGEAGETLRLALDFSRTVAERFRQGSVGRILGSERTGGQSVAPEMTLETSVGAGGTRGEVAAQQITAASPTDQTREAVRQYLLNRFNRTAVRDGRINPEQARKFVEDNADLLDRFPEMRVDMVQSGSAQELAERTARRARDVSQRLSQRSKSRVAEFLGADVDEEIDRVFKSSNPRQFAAELKKLVRKDNTGRAQQGLKTAVVDHLIRKSSREFDEAGNPILSGKALMGQLQDRKFRAAAQSFLTDAEFSRLNRVATELQRLEAAQGRLPDVGGVISDMPSNTLSIIARVLGAQQGRVLAGKMGGGTVQTPGIFAGRAQKLLEGITRDRARELLIQAVNDRELFRALMTGTRSPTTRKTANRRLNAWLATTGKEFLEDDED